MVCGTWGYLAYLLSQTIFLSFKQWLLLVEVSEITRIVTMWWLHADSSRDAIMTIYLTIVLVFLFWQQCSVLDGVGQ